MAKVKLTTGRISNFECKEGILQSFLWCEEVPGLGIRATAGSSRKRYIFQAKVKKKTMRITIGDVKIWSISNAQIEARRLQILIDQGHDPRLVKVEHAAQNEASVKARTTQEAREAVTVAQGMGRILNCP